MVRPVVRSSTERTGGCVVERFVPATAVKRPEGETATAVGLCSAGSCGAVVCRPPTQRRTVPWSIAATVAPSAPAATEVTGPGSWPSRFGGRLASR